MKLRMLTLTGAAVVAAAVTFIPVTVASFSTVSVASAAAYPTKWQEQRYRVRAAYPAATGRHDPCRDVWAFPTRYEQTAKSQCGDPH